MTAAGLGRPRQPRSLSPYIERDAEIARILVGLRHRPPGGRMENNLASR